MPPRRYTRSTKKQKPLIEKGSYDGVEYEMDIPNKTFKATLDGKEINGEVELNGEDLPDVKEIVKQIKIASLKPGSGYETNGPTYDIYYKESGFGMVHMTFVEPGDNFFKFLKRAVNDMSLEGTKYRPINIEAINHKIEYQMKKGRWTHWDINVIDGREIVSIYDRGDDDDRVQDDGISLLTMDLE